jgi:hypothetical protein
MKTIFSIWFWAELPGKIRYAYKTIAWTSNCWYPHKKTGHNAVLSEKPNTEL